MSRQKFPGWVSMLDPDPLQVEPEPAKAVAPRRGCLYWVLACILLLASLSNPVPLRAEEPEGAVGPIAVFVTRSGTWAYANHSHGPGYLAIPEGPGWHVTVCGPKGCLDRVSTDAGPELWLQRAGRIGDLSAVMFEEVCGPLSAGLCSGLYTITGQADQHPEDPPEHPDDNRMRAEDGPTMTLPPTDMVP